MRRLATVVVVMLMLGATGAASWADDPPEIPLTIEHNKFSPAEVKVKANTPFVLVVTNKDKTPEEVESKELRLEKVVPPGQTVKIRVRALKPGTYKFFGEYHEATAQGRIVAE
jgi:hypothetical protein